MKKVSILLLPLLSIVLLTGCGGSVKTTVGSWIENIISADQQKEQGFVLTSEMVYEVWYPDANSLDLSSKGLTAVPDLCGLLRVEDHENLWHLNLHDNQIKIVNQDLSCLKNLKTLNLSYNEIQVVKDLGILPNLVELKLHKNKLEHTKGLPDFPALESLNLGYNSLKDTIGLDKYANLEVLELYHNEIETVVGLEGLQKLEELKVEFNNIKDFGFVSTLKDQGLQLMTAKGNEIKDGLLDELKEMNNDYIDTIKDELELTAPIIEVNVGNQE